MTEIDRELQMQFVSEVYVSLVAHLTLFALLLTLVWSAVPPRVLAWWGGAIVVVSGIRTILWIVARRRNLPPRRATLMTRATMLALGLSWGVGAAFLFPYLPVADVALILLGLTGLLAGGLATLVADRWTFPIYAMAMFVPPTVVVGVTGPGMFDELGVVLMLTYVAFAIRLHLRSHHSLRTRLQVEAALREGERQLSEAQRIAHVGSFEWDIRTNVVTWSDELRRMFGLPADAPAGYREFLAIAHPDDRPRLEALVAEGVRTNQTSDYEWRVVRPDGEVRYLQARNVVITNDRGEAIRMAGTSLDITDRKRAEDALAQSERYHRALAEQSLDLTTLVDADGFVRYASPSYHRVLGYQPEQVIGQRVFDFVHPDDLAATLDIFTDGSTTPQATRTHEFRFRHHDGSWRVIAAVGRNLFDDPVIHAAIINGRDVTEHKKAAEHERTLLAELQRAIGEVRVLHGILPICASCKRIHAEDGSWEAVESYVRERTNAEFSHGLCPDCAKATWGSQG